MQNIQILYWVPVMFVVTYFWVAVVKKGRCLLAHGTLKSAVSQFKKANLNLVIIGWAWAEVGSYKV